MSLSLSLYLSFSFTYVLLWFWKITWDDFLMELIPTKNLIFSLFTSLVIAVDKYNFQKYLKICVNSFFMPPNNILKFKKKLKIRGPRPCPFRMKCLVFTISINKYYYCLLLQKRITMPSVYPTCSHIVTLRKEHSD